MEDKEKTCNTHEVQSVPDFLDIELERLGKKHKLLEIALRVDGENKPTILPEDFKHILITDRTITDDELNSALDLITSYFMQRNLYRLVSDLNARNMTLAPTKKLTLSQIEDLLGFKVEITNKEEE